MPMRRAPWAAAAALLLLARRQGVRGLPLPQPARAEAAPPQPSHSPCPLRSTLTQKQALLLREREGDTLFTLSCRMGRCDFQGKRVAEP